MEECPKNPFGMSAYDKWTLKQQILPIFHFDQISDGQMDLVLDIKEYSGNLLFTNRNSYEI